MESKSYPAVIDNGILNWKYPNEIAAYYDSLVSKHGPTHQAVDASSQESLNARYKVLSEIDDLNGKRILDVGCGFGGLGRYLKEKYLSIGYTGIDISSHMVEEARKACPFLVTSQSDVMDWQGEYDIVLAQGLFYKLPKNDYRTVARLIEKMFSLAKIGLAFTAIYGESDSDEFRLNADWVFRFCHELTPFMHIRTDYWPGDMAVYMFKG